MPCEHAETTTIAWLYDEAPDAHADHVASCATCRAVVAQHADVVAAIAPVAPALAAPVPSRLPRRWPWAAGLALAAAALVAVLASPAPTPAPPTAAPALVADDLDLRLDAVEHEILDLSLDLGGL